MVNGATSRLLYLGAYVITAICLLGVIFLSFEEKGVPSELTLALTSSIAFIAGSHIKPPVSMAATATAIDDTSKPA